jgi:hypothetical protein
MKYAWTNNEGLEVFFFISVTKKKYKTVTPRFKGSLKCGPSIVILCIFNIIHMHWNVNLYSLCISDHL